jgi:UDP-2,3-diacylglucosamine hydrolase
VSVNTEILFTSDLHLDQGKPEIIQQFLSFLKARATNARALYILGDLFEVWLGDDDEADTFADVFAALKEFSAAAELFFMPGNRDFLVGQNLAERLNMTLLSDPHLLQLGEQKIVLMHGDLLCSDDVDYQNFRKLVRQPQWQQDFLAKPLSERQDIAEALRRKSAEAMDQKSSQIMDVNKKTVEKTFADLGVDILIHGHTHRPAIHQLNGNKQRIVLGDWQPEASYLSWDKKGFTLHDSRLLYPPPYSVG